MDSLRLVLYFILTITVISSLISLFTLPYSRGYHEGLCHGKYGTGSTYTNGECFIPIK